MATRRWLSGATAVAQVDTLTVGGTIEADDLFIVTLTAEDGTTQTISTAAGSTTAATVATNIRTALAASTLSLFSAITWTTNSATVIGTAKTAGIPFYCTVSTTEAGGGGADSQTFTRAATTASAGPYDWNTALNWSGSTVPVDSDTVYIDEGTADILYGLNQSSIDLTLLVINQLWTGRLGTASAYLRIGTTTARIGEYYGTGNPNGSRRIKIDFGSAAAAVTIMNSASSAEESNQQPIRLKMNHASATLTVLKGAVGLCVGTAETGEISSLTVGYTTNKDSDSDVIVGAGVTIATVVKTGGKLLSLATISTSITQKGGTLTTAGTCTIATLAVYAGTAYPNSTGTITALEARGGTVDFTRSVAARTVSDMDLYAGASVAYDPTVVTVTAGPEIQEAMRIQTQSIY